MTDGSDRKNRQGDKIMHSRNRKKEIRGPGLRTVVVILTAVLLCLCAAAFPGYSASAPYATGRITESDGVNIRSSYSTSSAITGALPYNSSVSVLKEKYTKAGISAKDTIWYQITSGYGNGYIRADLASVSYSYGEGTITGKVSFRKGPGTDFAASGTLTKGTKVKVAVAAETAAGSSWYRIYHNSGYYYVSSKYVKLSETGGSTGGSGSGGGNISDAAFESMLKAESFPESYKAGLRILHKAHPKWTFRARHLDFTWKQALDKQCANVNANLVSRNFADGYKAVQKGTYDFENHRYIGKDGDSWVAASRQGVAYYMDPRNWLSESNIFMFEPNTYDPSYQTESMVRKILEPTALPPSAAAYYIAAAQQNYNGKNYTISPIYLATKTRLELGSGDFMVDGHAFTYGGKKFSGVYNTYNIGAVDSPDGSAATKGLVFAAGGINKDETSYLRPWNSLEKAVKGGAVYIADTFLARNQNSPYYERYNVVNGLSGIGTYQYATSIFAAATQSGLMYGDYYDFNVLNEAFTFEIPVYKDMPSSPAPMPGPGSNNCYLDSISVSAGSTKLSFTKGFDRFGSDFTVKQTVGASVDKLTIKPVKNDDSASVVISGNNLKIGRNEIKIKVKAPSGTVSKTYTLIVNKDDSGIGNPDKPENPDKPDSSLIDGVENTTIKASSALGEGFISLKWEKSYGYKVDYFEIYRSEVSGQYGEKPFFTTPNGDWKSYKNTKNLTADIHYYYRIRGVREIDGRKYYTKWSNQANRIYRLPENPQEPEKPEIPEEPSKEEKLIAGVEATTLKASSELGDGYIRVKWKKSYGYKMDAFEIYRSTKSGIYSEKPLYTTPNGKWVSYKNTKNLKKGTRYYYKVRGVREINGKNYYTRWSGQANRIYK